MENELFEFMQRVHQQKNKVPLSNIIKKSIVNGQEKQKINLSNFLENPLKCDLKQKLQSSVQNKKKQEISQQEIQFEKNCFQEKYSFNSNYKNDFFVQKNKMIKKIDQEKGLQNLSRFLGQNQSNQIKNKNKICNNNYFEKQQDTSYQGQSQIYLRHSYQNQNLKHNFIRISHNSNSILQQSFTNQQKDNLNRESFFKENLNNSIMSKKSNISHSCSRSSVKSTKKSVLKKITFNDENHLLNLKTNKFKLEEENQNIINQFFSKINELNLKVKQQLEDDFINNTRQIWYNFYLEKKNPLLNDQNFNIEQIFQQGLQLMKINFEIFTEKLISEKIVEIYLIIEINNLQISLEDPLQKTDCIYQLKKAYLLRQLISTTFIQYTELIKQEKNYLDKCIEIFLKESENEFRIHLNQSKELVQTTLKNSLSLLKNEDNLKSKELNELQNKTSQELMILQKEVNDLAQYLMYIKETNQ